MDKERYQTIRENITPLVSFTYIRLCHQAQYFPRESYFGKVRTHKRLLLG